MFGDNPIISPAAFEQIRMADPSKPSSSSLKVHSIFPTIQGEGPFSGHRCIFVRLSHCNYNCSFCDTAFESGTFYELDELSWLVHKADQDAFPLANVFTRSLVVITGGEPMMQRGLVHFTRTMDEDGFLCQIESNGSVHREISSGSYLVVSPKISDANGRYMEPNPKVLERLDCLKFVVSSDEEKYPGYQTIPEFALELRARRGIPIYISPMNVYARPPTPGKVVSFWEDGLLDLVQLQSNYRHAAQLAMAHGVIVSLQTHLFLGLA
jgi:7-carboxy-7-deazaguanine synthase